MALIGSVYTTNISGSNSQIGVTGSIVIANRPDGLFPDLPGLDTTFFVSGSVDARGGSDKAVTVFGGDTVVSGTLVVRENMSFDGSTLRVSGSFAQGDSSVASGQNSFASGYNTLAAGQNSHAEGESTIAGLKFVTAPSYMKDNNGNYAFPGTQLWDYLDPSHIQAPEGFLLHLDAADPNSYSGSGSTWYDLTGMGNGVELFGEPSYLSSNLGVLSFDKDSSQYAKASAGLSFDAFTLSTWVRLTSVPSSSDSAIVGCKKTEDSHLNLALGTFSGSNQIKVGIYDGSWVTTPGFSAEPGVWYHFGAMYDGSTLSFYVNGSLQGSVNHSAPLDLGGDLYIAKKGEDPVYFDCMVSTVKLYDQYVESWFFNEDYWNYYGNRFGYDPDQIAQKFSLDAVDYPSSGTDWIDSTNNVTATLVNSPTWNSSGYFTFNGVDQYVTIPSAAASYGGSRTIAAWVKTNSTTSAQTIFSFGTQDENSGVLGISGGQFNGGTDSTPLLGGTLAADTWYYVVQTYDQHTQVLKLFVNGELIAASSVLDRAAVEGDIYVGRSLSGAQFFNGSIAVVSFYEGAYSNSNVNSSLYMSYVYDRRFNPAPVLKIGLDAVSYSGTGDWIDSTGNGANVTLTGVPTWDSSGYFTLGGLRKGVISPDKIDFTKSNTCVIWYKPSDYTSSLATTFYPILATGCEGCNPSYASYIARWTNASNSPLISMMDGSNQGWNNHMSGPEWYHIVRVYDVETQKHVLYMNGQLVGQGALGTLPVPYKIVLGGIAGPGFWDTMETVYPYPEAQFAVFRSYEGAFGPDEVLADFNSYSTDPRFSHLFSSMTRSLLRSSESDNPISVAEYLAIQDAASVASVKTSVLDNILPARETKDFKKSLKANLKYAGGSKPGRALVDGNLVDVDIHYDYNIESGNTLVWLEGPGGQVNSNDVLFTLLEPSDYQINVVDHTVHGVGSHAEGVDTMVFGNYAHAEGVETSATGLGSHAEGYLTRAVGGSSHAEGNATTALGASSHAEGFQTQANKDNSHAEGALTVAGGTYYTGTIHDNGTKISCYNDISAIVNQYSQVKILILDSATPLYLEASCTSPSYNSTSEVTTFDISNLSFRSGDSAPASATSGIVQIKFAFDFSGTTGAWYPLGERAHAEGGQSYALGIDAHAEGYCTVALGGNSHAEGNSTLASGNSSHAEGSATRATGMVSHAEGFATKATGNSSHAEGEETEASAYASHSEGYLTKAQGNQSHAEGSETRAIAESSHAEGVETVAGAKFLTAEASSINGDGNYTFSGQHAWDYLDPGHDPVPLTGGLILQLRSEDLTGLSDGDNVTVWNNPDGVPTAYDNTEPSVTFGTSAPPVYVLPESPPVPAATRSYYPGYYPAVRFNENGLYVPNISLPQGSADFTVYIAFKPDQTTNYDQSIISYGSLPNQFSLSRRESGYVALLSGYDSRSQGAPTVNGTGCALALTYPAHSDMSQIQLTADGVNYEDGSGAYGPELNIQGSNFTIGHYTTGAGWYFKGDIYEIRVYDIYHDSVTRSEITQDLAWKYGFAAVPAANRSSLKFGQGSTPGYAIIDSKLVNVDINYDQDDDNNQTLVWFTDPQTGERLTSSSDVTFAPTLNLNSPPEDLTTVAMKGIGSHVEGNNTFTLGDYSHAEGQSTKAVGLASHAEGSSSVASGDSSHAEGESTVASGDNSHAEGYQTHAAGNRSHASGRDTLAGGYAFYIESFNAYGTEATVAPYNGGNAAVLSTFSPGDVILGASRNAAFTVDGAWIDEGENRVKLGLTLLNNGNTSLYNFDTSNGFFVNLSKPAAGIFNDGPNTDSQAGEDAAAQGRGTVATGARSHSEGYNTRALGAQSHAEGQETMAFGGYSHAEGDRSIAYGDASHAEGYKTLAQYEYSHAEGQETVAVGSASHAEGYKTLAGLLGTDMDYMTDNVIYGGWINKTPLRDAIENSWNEIYLLQISAGNIVGVYEYVVDNFDGDNDTIILSSSHSNPVSFTDTVSIVPKRFPAFVNPNGFRRMGTRSHAEGQETMALGDKSHAEGYLTRAAGHKSHAEGESTSALGSSSHAEGVNAIARGNGSHAEGHNTVAQYDYSHAEGENSFSIGQGSHAEGFKALAGVLGTAMDSMIEGTVYGDLTNKVGLRDAIEASFGDIYLLHMDGDKVIGMYEANVASNMWGSDNFSFNSFSGPSSAPGPVVIIPRNVPDYVPQDGLVRFGDYAHAEGEDTKALGRGAHAEGSYSNAIGDYSHAEGLGSKALGDYSHAEGWNTVASGSYSHAEGCDAVASGMYSHASGLATTAAGSYSHAAGEGTIASSDAQSALGKYNVGGNDGSLFTIGDGGSPENRHDLVNAKVGLFEVSGTLEIKFSDGEHVTTMDGPSFNMSRADGSHFHIDQGAPWNGPNMFAYNGPNSSVTLGYNNPDGNGQFWIADDTGTSEVRIETGTPRLTVTSGSVEIIKLDGSAGIVTAQNGFSGSLTTLADGSSYLVAGDGINIVTGSNGSVTLSFAAGGTGAGWVGGFGSNNQMLTADGSGGIVAESNVSFTGSGMEVTGSLDVSGQVDLGATDVATNVRGTLNVTQTADFNGSITTNKISIDGAAANRLYVVDSDGSMKDESKLVFDGSRLSVTGSLDVSGQVDLGDTGVATNVRGTLNVSQAADFNGSITTNKISIDGDTAQRLYIVGSDGALKDESKLTFDGTSLNVTGNLTVSGDVVVNGETVVVNTTNLEVSDSMVGFGFSSGSVAAPAGDRGWIGGIASGDNVVMMWDNSEGEFAVGRTTSNASESSFEISSYSNLHAADILGSVVTAENGFSGSLTRLADGSSYLRAGDGINIVTGSNGSITFSFAAGGTGAGWVGGFGSNNQMITSDGNGGIVAESNVSFNGSGMEVTGSLDVSSQVDLGAAGVATNVRGTLNVTQAADFNGSITTNKISIDGDTANRLYIVDSDGSMKDESKLVFDGSRLSVTGSLAATGAVTFGSSMRVEGSATFGDLGVQTLVKGILAVEQTADVNQLWAHKVNIYGDTANRLYIVDSDGSMKDESKLTFDGSSLKVTGALSGSGAFQTGGDLTVAGSTDLNGSLDVFGAVALASAGVATDVRGSLFVAQDASVSGSLTLSGSADFNGGLTVAGASILNNGLTVNAAVADFNSGVTANEIKIDGDVAQRLYIVDSDGSMKDESKLTFNGTSFSVTGDIKATAGLSGSLTTLTDGTPYLIAGDGISIITGSNGSVTFSFAAGGTGAGWVGGFGSNNQMITSDGNGGIVAESNITFDGGTLNVNGNAVVSGDLSVMGNITSIDTVNLEVRDSVIGLGFASGSVQQPAGDRGWVGGMGGFDNVMMKWDNSASEFMVGRTTSSATGSLDVAAYSDFHAAKIIGSSALFSGDIMPTADRVFNLGSEDIRWANIYTGDLHLKNERGHWTVIEENDYLSIRNNKTGVLYKFVMEPVVPVAKARKPRTRKTSTDKK
jgi:hypothetical protein